MTSESKSHDSNTPDILDTVFCVGGSCQIRYLKFGYGIASIKSKLVSEVVKGDYIYTGAHDSFAKVLCVVKFPIRSDQKMYHVFDAWVNPKQPIKTNINNDWKFPENLYAEKDHRRYTEAFAYNLVLESTHHFSLNDNLIVATLGHQSHNDPVAGHPYFGSSKILTELSNLPGYEEGFVDLSRSTFNVDTDTSLINGVNPA